MPHTEKKDGYCNARVKNIPDDMDVDEAYCAHYEGFRCDDPDAKRCYLHGGRNTGGKEGNRNAEKHGLFSQRQPYYEHRPEEQRAWIDAVVESLLDDLPGEPTFAKVQMIRNIAIDMHKLRNANDYIDEVGVVHRDKTVGYTDDGRPIKMDEENTINVAYDRLNKTITRQLKELSILDSPDKQDAEAKEDIASELSKLRSARDSDE